MGKLTKEQIDFIKNNPDKTCRELSEMFKCDRNIVGKHKKRFGIAYSQTHDFSSYYDYIISQYNKKSARKIAEEIGCSTAEVSNVWHKAGLKGKTNRTHYLNEDYFNEINNQFKAYFIGLIASDGCLYSRKDHIGMVSIILKNDVEIIEKFCEVLEYEKPYPIYYNKNKNTYSFQINSNKIFNALKNVGLEERKTWNLNIEKILNNIPVEFHKDFIRGYFDGDGSVQDNKDNIARSSVSIAAPIPTCESLKKILDYGSITVDKREGKYSNGFGSFICKNTTEKYVFLKYIYYNCEVCLTRKKEIADRLINKIEENKTNRAENKRAIIKWGELLESLR